MNNLKEYELIQLSTVVGGGSQIEFTGKVSGIGDGIKRNTVIWLDFKTTPKN